MPIHYDPQADALYIQLRDGAVDNTHEVDRHIYVDVDAEGVPLGLEVLVAAKKDLSQLLNVSVWNKEDVREIERAQQHFNAWQIEEI